MALLEGDKERAESYRILADLFFAPPEAERLESIRENLGLDSKEEEEEIIADFDSLFISPEGDLPPLESLHAEGTNITESVTGFYYGTGLTFDEEYETLPDHISLEFLFMSYLIDIDNRELQQKFLEQHIANWVPYYCEKVMKQAKTLFYREIAEITKDFIDNEYEGIG
jgi:TorA maturation chaperone TorD